MFLISENGSWIGCRFLAIIPLSFVRLSVNFGFILYRHHERENDN